MSIETSRLPVTRDEIAALVPHQGAMCLLDSVKEWTEDAIVCGSRSHALPDHPLRRRGHLSAVHLCEYGAQAAAVHGALGARKQRTAMQPGLLVALRDIELAVAMVDADGSLEIRARLLQSSTLGSHYEFTVRQAEATLASGRITVMVPRAA